MAQVWTFLSGLDWSQHSSDAWQFAQSSRRAAFAYLAALPRDCTLASLHASMVCLGTDVAYYTTPGFGPFSLAWGWALVGVMLGGLITFLMLSATGRMRREPTLATFASMTRTGPPTVATTTAADQARQDLLDYIAIGGRPALQEIATSTGMNESEVLMNVFGVQRIPAVPSSTVAPLHGLSFLQQRNVPTTFRI